jgi:hypothetical protein
MVSADLDGLKRASFQAASRAKLDAAKAERTANILSNWRSLSGAWGLTNLLYKLFVEHNQPLSKMPPPKSLISVRLDARRRTELNRSYQPQAWSL